jgi:hypothetical protein
MKTGKTLDTITGAVAGTSGTVSWATAAMSASRSGTGDYYLYAPPNFTIVNVVTALSGGACIVPGVVSIDQAGKRVRVMTVNQTAAVGDADWRFIAVGYWTD